MLDIAVVGAGPAGYSAAITARKRDKSFFVASAKKKTTSGAGEREKLKIQEAPPLL